MKFVGYVRRNSPIHRLDPRTKLLMMASIVGLSFLFPSPIPQLALLSSIILLSYLARVHKEFLPRFRALSGMVVAAFFLWSLFYRYSLFSGAGSSEVLFSYGPITLDTFGLFYGLSMALRVLVMIGAPLLLLMTTTVSELAGALTKFGVPYKAAFTFGLSMRLVPSLADEMVTIKEAQSARGLELDKGGLISRIKGYIPILIPLMLRAFELSDRMSVAMGLKGFGSGRRTSYRRFELERRDVIALALAALALTLAALLKLGVL